MVYVYVSYCSVIYIKNEKTNNTMTRVVNDNETSGLKSYEL